MPNNGWKVVVWWTTGIAGAIGLTLVGQPHLAGVLIGGLAGVTAGPKLKDRQPRAPRLNTPPPTPMPLPSGAPKVDK